MFGSVTLSMVLNKIKNWAQRRQKPFATIAVSGVTSFVQKLNRAGPSWAPTAPTDCALWRGNGAAPGPFGATEPPQEQRLGPYG